MRQPSSIYLAYTVDQVAALLINKSNKPISIIISHSGELDFIVYRMTLLSSSKHWNCLLHLLQIFHLRFSTCRRQRLFLLIKPWILCKHYSFCLWVDLDYRCNISFIALAFSNWCKFDPSSLELSHQRDFYFTFTTSVAKPFPKKLRHQTVAFKPWFPLLLLKRFLLHLIMSLVVEFLLLIFSLKQKSYN